MYNNSTHASHRHTARDLLDTIFKRFRMLLLIPILIVFLIIAGTMFMPKVFEASTELTIEETNYENIGISDVEIDRSSLFSRKDQQINSEINIIQSNIVLEAVVRNLELWEAWDISGDSEQERIAATVGRLAGAISAEPKQDSWIISIKCRDENPQLAADIVNEIATEYIVQNVNLKKLPEAAEFYKDKLDREIDELNGRQEDLNRLKKENQLFDYDIEIEQKITTRSNFENQLTEVKKNILSRQAELQKIAEFLRENEDILVPIPEIAHDRIIEDLNYRLVNLKLELESLLERYTDEERQVKMVKAQIVEVEKQIRSEVQKIISQKTTELSKLRSEQSALEGSVAEIDNQLLNLTSVESEYVNLKQRIKDKQEIVSDLTKQYADRLYAGESDSRIGRVKQIGKALVPSSPSFPSMRLNLMLGIPFAILLGLAAVFLLEYFDRSFSSPDKVESILGLPVLATLNVLDLKKNPLFKQ